MEAGFFSTVVVLEVLSTVPVSTVLGTASLL